MPGWHTGAHKLGWFHQNGRQRHTMSFTTDLIWPPRWVRTGHGYEVNIRIVGFEELFSWRLSRLQSYWFTATAMTRRALSAETNSSEMDLLAPSISSTSPPNDSIAFKTGG